MTRNFRKSLLASIALFGLAVSPTLAEDHYWLANPGLSGTINNVTNWDNGYFIPGPTYVPADGVPGSTGDTVPGSSDLIIFNNNAGSAYTVSLNANIQTSWYRIPTDKVTFDLAGFDLIARDATTTYVYGGGGSEIAGYTGQAATVTVSSSAAGTNSMRNFLNGSDAPYVALLVGTGYTGGATATLNIDKSLGFAAKLENSGNVFIGGGYYGSTVTVNIDGVGSEFNTYQAGGGQFTDISGGATVNITNGGKLHTWYLQTAQSYLVTYVNVQSGGILEAADGIHGVFDPSVMTIDTGGTWTARDVHFGQYRFYSGDSTYARMSVNGATSSANFRNLTFSFEDGNAGNGSLTLTNSGKATVAQTLRLNVLPASAPVAADKNTLTLNTGILEMGSVGTAGQVQIGGVLRGNGSINKATGSPNFTVSVGITNASDSNTGGEVRPGDLSVTPTIGEIDINNGSLALNASGTIYFNLAAGSLADLIKITDGNATLSGNLNYTVLGAWTPAYGEIFNFLKADSITLSPASDNMAALMTSKGYAPGTYFYGVDQVGGQDVLFLQIPEPASMGLLTVGGLMMFRRNRRSNPESL